LSGNSSAKKKSEFYNQATRMNHRKARPSNIARKESFVSSGISPSSQVRPTDPEQLLVELKYLCVLHENILLKMLRSKWLVHFQLTSKGKWQLEWTKMGTQRLAGLKAIIESYRLKKDDLFPIGFTLLARDGKPARQLSGVPVKTLDFWRNCCNEISLANSLEECALLVQIVSSADP